MATLLSALAAPCHADTSSDTSVSPDTASAPAATTTCSDNLWDGVVGVKGRGKLTDRWYLPYYADVGTGQSEYTWQAYAGIACRFSKVDAVPGYRYAAWKFDDDVARNDLQLHGPMLGAEFQF